MRIPAWRRRDEPERPEAVASVAAPQISPAAKVEDHIKAPAQQNVPHPPESKEAPTQVAKPSAASWSDHLSVAPCELASRILVVMDSPALPDDQQQGVERMYQAMLQAISLAPADVQRLPLQPAAAVASQMTLTQLLAAENYLLLAFLMPQSVGGVDALSRLRQSPAKPASSVVTWHPAWLLANVSHKRETWQDLKRFRALLDAEP